MLHTAISMPSNARSPASPRRRTMSPNNGNRRQGNNNTGVHYNSRPRRDVSRSHLREPDTSNTEQVPPLAGPEIDDLDIDEAPGIPQPGVDDGFFGPEDNPGIDDGLLPKDDRREDHPNIPETPEKVNPNDNYPPEYPDVGTRANFPPFPYAPGYGGQGGIPEAGVVPREIPDVNVYQHKKTLAQGMMDLALLSANANQLRYVLESYKRHPYYYPSLVFISLSIILQVAVGVGLIWNSRYNVKSEDDICKADKINNYTVIGIFLITIVNVFVSSFGVADAGSM